MRTREIDGTEYMERADGVLIPASFVREATPIHKPEQAARLLVEEGMAEQERFVVLTLDGAYNVIKKHTITIGLADRSQVHPRETFRQAIKDNAIAIMIAHNHPSGSLEASANDLLTTRRLAQAGALLRIPVLDHLIVSRNGFISIREKFPDYFNANGKGDVDA
jgi:DNA repair protein RadC